MTCLLFANSHLLSFTEQAPFFFTPPALAANVFSGTAQPVTHEKFYPLPSAASCSFAGCELFRRFFFCEHAVFFKLPVEQMQLLLKSRIQPCFQVERGPIPNCG